MVWGKQGHAPCNASSWHSIIMGAKKLKLAAPAYHKEEGAIPYPGVCKYSLQYDGKPDGRICVWVGMLNLGCLRGKGG